MSHPTETSPFLGDSNNGRKGAGFPGLSLFTHFLVGFLGVVVGTMVMRHTMESSPEISASTVPILGHPKASKTGFMKRVVDKGNWIESFGISRGVLTTSPDGIRHLYASGQSPFDGEKAEGSDMASQMKTDLKFIDVTLKDAKMSMCDIVRINVFTTDIDATLAAWDDVYVAWVEDCPVKPASTLVGVTSLFSPDLLVEIQVEAVSAGK